MDRACSTYVVDRRCTYRVLVGRRNGRRPFGRHRHGWDDNIKKNLQEVCVGRAWIWLIWIRIRAVGGSLWMRWWTFGFHKMRGIPWLAEDLLASQEGLCCMEFHWCVISEYLWQYLLLLSCSHTGHCWCVMALYVFADTVSWVSIRNAGAKTLLMGPIQFLCSN